MRRLLMRNDHRVRAVLCNLAWKVAALGVAATTISFCLPAVPGGSLDAPRDVRLEADARARCDTTRVTMSVREGRLYATYLLEGGGGKEVVRVTYVRSGDVAVKLGDAFPVRPGFSARWDGTCVFAATDGDDVCYRLKMKPGGPSGFSISDAAHGVKDGLMLLR
jgi:hypothetical protein